MMRRLFLMTVIVLCATDVAHAVPGGRLGVLQQGAWTCEKPGSAEALPVEVPELNFTTIPDSSYIAPDGGRGSYLRLADRLTLTSGPFAGRRFVMDGEEILRELDTKESMTGLRCVHSGSVSLAS